MKYLMLFVSVMAFASDGIESSQVSEGWSIDRRVWKQALAAGSVIEVENPYGNVRVRGADDDLFEMTGNIQKKQGDENHVEVVFDKLPNGVRARVIYKGDEADTAKRKGKRRADLALFVPNGSHLSVTTYKGLIEVKNVKGDVVTNTFSGKTFVRNQGHLKVYSRQGNVRAVLLETKWNKPPKLETVLGELEVVLPLTANVVVKAETRGHVTSDYSMSISKNTEMKTRIAKIKIGEGVNSLELGSEDGDIRILEGNYPMK